MGLLDSLVGGITGSPQNSGLGGVLMNLLGGGHQAEQGSGLGALLSSFQQAGLGHIAQSWVGNGPNQAVSPDQLQRVFGEDRVRNMADNAGLQPHDFLSQLSQHLPNVVNGMTPDGRVPSEGTVSV
jgi:uncharacterized protein YidB (DUF937 family)